MSEKANIQITKNFQLLVRFFFFSDKKFNAWLLLMFALLFSVFTAVTIILFPWLFSIVWTALAAMQLVPFLISVIYFGLAIILFVVFDAFKTYCSGKLAIEWRKWLTVDLINKIMQSSFERDYHQTENLPQRIQEDIKVFVNSSLNFLFNGVKYGIILVFFTINVWFLGSTLSLSLLGISIVIPGFLFWAALLITIGAAVTTHLIGKNLIKANKTETDVEANLRLGIDTVFQTNANKYLYLNRGNSLEVHLVEVSTAADQKLSIQTKVGMFQDFYIQFIYIMPYLLSAPFYLTGQFTMAKIIQIGAAFGEINYASNWFITSYEAFTSWKTSFNRISEIFLSDNSNAAIPYTKHNISKNKLFEQKKMNENYEYSKPLFSIPDPSEIARIPPASTKLPRRLSI